MNRSINERKAQRFISLGFLMNYLSLFLFGWSVRKPTIILGALCIGGYFIGLMLLCYNCYSLGWEYKRVSDVKRTNEVNNGK